MKKLPIITFFFCISINNFNLPTLHFRARPEHVEGFSSSARGYPSTCSGRAQRRSERVFTTEPVEVSGRAQKTISLWISSKNIYPNIKKFVGYHNIATHIHCIKCLSKSTHLLSRLCKQHYYYKPCNCIEQKDCIRIDSTIFSHQKLRDCLQKMVLTGSLKPLLVLLREVKNYRLLQDSLFFHEFFVLIFTVHKQILFHECEENPHALKHTTFETIIDISNKINQLPIAEVLSAIDMLVTELPIFLEKYEFHSKITWQEWLKKYWWVPPVFGAWFGLKILLRLQRPQFFYSSPYLAPRPQIPLEPIVLVEPTELTNPVLLEIRQNKKD